VAGYAVSGGRVMWPASAGIETMPDNIWGIVLAGGRGTRFWPVSTRARPKQFIDLLGGGTLLQQTVRRLGALCSPARVLIVTGAEYSALAREQLPGIPEENILLEPCPRNTSASIGWAAGVMASRGAAGDLMAVVPSDHSIRPDEGFTSTLLRAAVPASEGWLMTLGIRPDRPATGYGYLEAGESMGGFLRVVSFREKPDAATAASYLAGGRHFWNAGIFMWKAEAILEEIGRLLPDLASGLTAVGTGPGCDPEVFGALPVISIDYGVMEKAGRVGMVEAAFEWDDVGDWPAARRAGIARGGILQVDSGDCTVWNPGRLTVILGVRGLSIVEAGDVTLVMSDEYSQKLRDVVAELERERPDLV